ncbi:aldo/keto reductase [Reyranella sp. CPCC 100927]|uniref:aldo/keto reductase n=1 Tax=Reyranella sp. CPCC 100927 TaxID=2599616 RepID=UPI0011B3858C|nr:aldo/keto reductase [Reyranella sp. CPCC 100927]TWT15514.1 aldo/keto reductase [Reyranella sp. CPCC 100927]
MTIPSVELPSGARMPTFGIGTWRMGEDRRRRKDETDAIRHGIDLGFTLIDTAEMYGEGGAEEAIADAIAGRRDGLTIVSKIYPHNASRRGAVTACERSLKRLRIDRIDLYLLHWIGGEPFEETIAAFETLRDQGKIADWGVSNFDRDDLQSWHQKDGGRCGTNQVMFNLARRGVEFDLLPWMQQHKMPLMAYSPFDRGPLARDRDLKAIADRHGATPAQVALAWLLQLPGVVAIPKSVDKVRLSENFGALKVKLSDADLADLDRAFPPPRRKQSLSIV